MILLNDDCLNAMPDLPEHSVDMILCDLPYEVTHNQWDTIIPFDKLWREYKRLLKPNAACVLFGQGLFSAKLIMSNPEMYRYSLVWDKERVTGFLNANRMPLRCHEDIMVFYEKLPVYNPQMTQGSAPSHKRGAKAESAGSKFGVGKVYGKHVFLDAGPCTQSDLKFPTSIIRISNKVQDNMHPTQKPVELLEYLIKTYTNEGMTVLDNCMGSGSTGIACLKQNREFIGIEKDPVYFKTAEERIQKFKNAMITEW